MAQLSFEHYEKMTDTALSLEGKANYLSPIIQRNNLSSRCSCCPARRLGRACRWGESSNTTAPGLLRTLRFLDDRFGNSLRRRNLATRFNAEMDRDAAIELGALAMYEAGDNDRAPGTDFVRNLFPMIVTISSEGFQELAPMTSRNDSG